MSAEEAIAGALLIVHRAPVRGLELELMARAAFPLTMPIIAVGTPAEAYQALRTHTLTVALLEETSDMIAFARHAAQERPGLIVGWIRNGATGEPPPIGFRLQTPIVSADLAALAARLPREPGKS